MAPGSGLGLYFANQIIQAHGCSIELEDETACASENTVLRLTLPLVKSAGWGDLYVHRTAQCVARRRRALLPQSVANVPGSQRISHRRAPCGEEAIAILAQPPFDLVLLDINMKGIGGVETGREVRSFLPKIGIVTVTGRDAENDMVRALEAPTTTLPNPFAFAN